MVGFSGFRGFFGWLSLCFGLLLLAAGAFAAPPTCDACHRPISGRYMIYKNDAGREIALCATCERTRPKCRLCNLPVMGRVDPGKVPLCSTCMRTATRCTICQQVSPFEYQVYDINGSEYIVCKTCQQTQQKCAGCNVPVSSKYLTKFPNGQFWCRLCLREAQICGGCMSPIVGKYYKLDDLNESWCASCYESGAKCQICQRPIAGDPTLTPDGRRLCRVCTETLVSGTERYESIAKQIRPAFKEILGSDVRHVPIRAVGIGELRMLFKEGGIKTSGHTKPEDFVEEAGLYRVKGNLREIAVLDSLPEDMVWETIAHEMSHAWQEEHFPECTDLMISEGFAQWMAEQICVKYKHGSTLARLRARPDVYGRGYRVMTSLEIVGGTERIMEVLKKNKVE